MGELGARSRYGGPCSGCVCVGCCDPASPAHSAQRASGWGPGGSREGGRKGGREAGRQRWKEGGREAGRQASWEGVREGGKAKGREGGRDGGREGGRKAGRKEGWQAGRQAGTEAGQRGEAGRQGGREGGRVGILEPEAPPSPPEIRGNFRRLRSSPDQWFSIWKMDFFVQSWAWASKALVRPGPPGAGGREEHARVIAETPPLKYYIVPSHAFQLSPKWNPILGARYK